METPLIKTLSPKAGAELLAQMAQLQALCLACQQEIDTLWYLGYYHPFFPNENWFDNPAQEMLFLDEQYKKPTRAAANDAAKAIMLKRKEMLDNGWQTRVTDLYAIYGGKLKPCLVASLDLFERELPMEVTTDGRILCSPAQS